MRAGALATAARPGRVEMEKLQIRVSGMTCGGCERSVQKALTSRQGVASAKADHAAGVVAVEFDPAVIARAGLEKAITEAGFQVTA